MRTSGPALLTRYGTMVGKVLRERIRYLSDLVGEDGYVVTCGGIGPTHDDITYDAVAAAFNVDLAVHEPTRDALKKINDERGQVLTPERLRMATLPVGAHIYQDDDLWVPLVVMHNVCVLPGIPWLYRKMMDLHAHIFVGGTKLTRAIVREVGPACVVL